MVDRLTRLKGERYVIDISDPAFPDALRRIERPPSCLYVIGNPMALEEGLAVVGARRATPYGIGCARRFAKRAAERGICIVSGGARGCDSASHEAALEAGGMTLAFLGGGLDEIYPIENTGLFQRMIEAGGAVVSEREWGFKPMPFAFRERNRLIAGLAKATLIVEAGLPSGTFSTADEALAAGREVLVVPGAITSLHSRGANRLLCQGARPVVDDESFDEVLFDVFGCLRQHELGKEPEADPRLKELFAGAFSEAGSLYEALRAEPLGLEELRCIAEPACPEGDVTGWLMMWLAHAQRLGVVARYPDGRFGPALVGKPRRKA